MGRHRQASDAFLTTGFSVASSKKHQIAIEFFRNNTKLTVSYNTDIEASRRETGICCLKSLFIDSRKSQVGI